ncbi:hypothetical protein [Sphingomonas sp. Leaf25]|uniref:hypothetical protein n=1 Tax=Sphingomonas sp. Leaf25 TaxID=1735692 RepID=UPI0007002A45|nr:hypothetical protein [Sphingomonas sp. Leaf25]KQM98119.1 hypothetical protein ASE78_07615 [Sphingomonas sp. Leaf25]
MAPIDRPAPLVPGLLARRGEARPAMRPGGIAGMLVEDDDLGWNDFGQSPDPRAELPAVLQQRAQLQQLTLGSDAVPVAPPEGEVAALTLTLDPDRLWRLRLAAAACGLSVEAWLVDAIDRLLPPPSDLSSTPVSDAPKVQP